MNTPEVTSVSPREERRRVRMETTRSQILDAAEQAFAAAGFHNTTIKSIAERCEIAVGTMYLLFADKESVYQAVLRRRGDTLHALVAAMAAEPGPGDERLVELAELQIQFFRAHSEWARVASGLVSGSRAALTTAGSSQIYEVGHRVVADVIAAVIARGQFEGRVRDGNPQGLALIFLGMLETFHTIDNAGTAPSAGYGLAEFLDMVRAAFTSSDRRGIDL